LNFAEKFLEPMTQAAHNPASAIGLADIGRGNEALDSYGSAGSRGSSRRMRKHRDNAGFSASFAAARAPALELDRNDVDGYRDRPGISVAAVFLQLTL
jgi:hypothetical protein